MIDLSDQDLVAMKAFYQQELERTFQRLEHIKRILEKIDANGPSISISYNQPEAPKATTAIASSVEETAAPLVAEAPVQKRKKKRGPKPVWGNFILKRLRQLDRPISYNDLIDDAMVYFKTPAENRLKTRHAISNSAFRLRTIQKKIDTVAIKGKKEKYLVLKRWVDNGVLKEDYQDKLRLIFEAKQGS